MASLADATDAVSRTALYFVPLKWCTGFSSGQVLPAGAVLAGSDPDGFVGCREVSLAVGRGRLPYVLGDPVVLGSFADADAVTSDDAVYFFANSVRVVRVLGPEECVAPVGEVYITATTMCFPYRRGTELPYVVRVCLPPEDTDDSPLVPTRALLWTELDFRTTREVVMAHRVSDEAAVVFSDVTKVNLFPVAARPLASLLAAGSG